VSKAVCGNCGQFHAMGYGAAGVCYTGGTPQLKRTEQTCDGFTVRSKCSQPDHQTGLDWLRESMRRALQQRTGDEPV